MSHIIGLVLILLAQACRSVDETEIVQVQILFSDGDRTPLYLYPNDPYGEAVWQKYGGLGQLTQKGIQQLYQYGFKHFKLALISF